MLLIVRPRALLVLLHGEDKTRFEVVNQLFGFPSINNLGLNLSNPVPIETYIRPIKLTLDLDIHQYHQSVVISSGLY